MKKRLQDKVIIITGGSGLIGKAIVSQAREEGAIAINADLNTSDNLNDLEIDCDITQPDSVEKAIQRIMNRYGRIDGLVNNAYPRTSDWGMAFEDIPYTSWQKNVDMQMNSYFYCCQQVLKVMSKQRSGAIVNIASIYGVVGNDFTIYENTSITPASAYSAIKGGLINFSRFLASKYGANGIRINCLSPGGIFDHQPVAFVQQYEHKVPMKRMGQPEDIAPPVCFLLSEEARYITGHNLLVDGGWTAI